MKGSSDTNAAAAPDAAPPASTADAPTPRTTLSGKARKEIGAQGGQVNAPSNRKRGREDDARQTARKRARRTFDPLPQGRPPTSTARSKKDGSARAKDGRASSAPAALFLRVPKQQQPATAASGRAHAPVHIANETSPCTRVRVFSRDPAFASLEGLRLPRPVWAHPPPLPPALPITLAQHAAFAAHKGARCPVPGCGARAGLAHLETHLVPEMNVCGLCGLAYPSEIEVTLHVSAAHRWTIMGHDVLLSQ